MKQLVYIPYNKSYKVEYGVNGSATTERLFINEIKNAKGGVVTTGLPSEAVLLGFPDEYAEITKATMEALAVSKNHTLLVFEPGQAVVTKNTAKNIENYFKTFTLAAQTGAAVIDAAAGTVAITVANGTNVTALVATFTTSADITSIKIGATAQVSASTANNFTSPKTYRVISEHGEIKDWVVTVTVAGA